MSKSCCKKPACKNKCVCTPVPGAPGMDGVNGSVILVKPTPPLIGSGRDGDIGVDSTNGKWYEKESGAWTEFIQLQKVNSDGSVGIGTLTPEASAQLDVVSTDKGVLIPRLTTEQRVGISAPATGLIVYDSGLNKFFYWNSAAWTEISTSVVANSNFAENDLTLSGDRIHDFNNNEMNFNKVDGLGIGSSVSSTDPSALLDLSSTTKGFLVPRMTTIQRTSISPAEGLIIYDTTLNSLYVYNGSSWKDTSLGDLTLYASDGDLSGNRILSGAGNYYLQFGELQYHRVLVNTGSGVTGDYIYNTSGFGYFFSGGATINSTTLTLDQTGFIVAFSHPTPLSTSEYLTRLTNAVSSGDVEFHVNALGQLVLGSLNAIPNSTALVDFQSTTKGALLPRMTTAQIAAILTPATGLLAYDTTTNELKIYNGSSWVAFSLGPSITSVTATLPVQSSGGATPDISMSQATTSIDGYLRSTDWNTFNNKNNGLFAQTADSSTVTGTTEASIIGAGVGTLVVPASTFKVGDSFKAKIGGVIDSTANGDNVTINIYADGSLLATTGVFDLDSTTNNGWELELDFTIRTIGATGSVATNGNFAYTKVVDKKVQGYCFQDTQALNTTISNALDIRVVWGQTGTTIYSSNFTLHRVYAGV